METSARYARIYAESVPRPARRMLPSTTIADVASKPVSAALLNATSTRPNVMLELGKD